MIDFWDNTTRLVGLAELLAWALWAAQLIVVTIVCALYHKKTDGMIWGLPICWGLATLILTGVAIVPAFIRLIAGVNA